MNGVSKLDSFYACDEYVNNVCVRWELVELQTQMPILPYMTIEQANSLAWAIVGCWVIAYCCNLIYKMI